jgi:hypothetical protein
LNRLKETLQKLSRLKETFQELTLFLQTLVSSSQQPCGRINSPPKMPLRALIRTKMSLCSLIHTKNAPVYI